MNLFGLMSNNKSVLSDREIIQMSAKGMLFETPIDPDQIQPNSVDLRLGETCSELRVNTHLRGGGHYIDTHSEIKYRTGRFNFKLDQNGNKEPFYMLAPGEFVLMASKDVINIPNGIIGFVQGRSSIARLGIQTEQAGLIDAGFRGTITFEVFNQTKYYIKLYAGMRFAQVYFFHAQNADKLYGKEHQSKYMNQSSATGSKIHLDK